MVKAISGYAEWNDVVTGRKIRKYEPDVAVPPERVEDLKTGRREEDFVESWTIIEEGAKVYVIRLYPTAIGTDPHSYRRRLKYPSVIDLAWLSERDRVIYVTWNGVEVMRWNGTHWCDYHTYEES